MKILLAITLMVITGTVHSASFGSFTCSQWRVIGENIMLDRQTGKSLTQALSDNDKISENDTVVDKKVIKKLYFEAYKYRKSKYFDSISEFGNQVELACTIKN